MGCQISKWLTEWGEALTSALSENANKGTYVWRMEAWVKTEVQTRLSADVANRITGLSSRPSSGKFVVWQAAHRIGTFVGAAVKVIA